MGTELRQWMTADAAALLTAVVESPDLTTQLGGADLRSVEDCADFIDGNLAQSSRSARNFAITVDGTTVGNVGINNIERTHDTAWIYYWVTSSVRGRGLATKALATVARWAFDDVRLFRLELGHRANNPASCRVADGAGFPVEGLERKKLRYAGERYDVETHARLRHDPAPVVSLLHLIG